MLYEFGDFNLTDKFAPVWARDENSGFALGSAGVFLVIESQGARRGARRQAVCEADQRGRRPRAAQTARRGDQIAGSAVVETRHARRQGRADHRRDRRRAGHIGGKSLSEPASRLCGARHRNLFGHTLETQFPLGLALAALSISRGALFPPNDPTGLEVEMSGAADPDCGGGGRSLAGRGHGPGRGHQVEHGAGSTGTS